MDRYRNFNETVDEWRVQGREAHVNPQQQGDFWYQKQPYIPDNKNDRPQLIDARTMSYETNYGKYDTSALLPSQKPEYTMNLMMNRLPGQQSGGGLYNLEETPENLMRKYFEQEPSIPEKLDEDGEMAELDYVHRDKEKVPRFYDRPLLFNKADWNDDIGWSKPTTYQKEEKATWKQGTEVRSSSATKKKRIRGQQQLVGEIPVGKRRKTGPELVKPNEMTDAPMTGSKKNFPSLYKLANKA